MVTSGSFGVRASVGIPKITTAYARYVGRVGALAVALGIGATAGTWPAVSFAEPTSSETSSTSSDSTSEPDGDATSTPLAGAPTTSTPTSDPSSAPPPTDNPNQSDAAPSTPDPRDGIVQAGGGAEVRTTPETNGTVIANSVVARNDSDTTLTPPINLRQEPRNDTQPAEKVKPPTEPFTVSNIPQVESTVEKSTPADAPATITAASLPATETAVPTVVVQAESEPAAEVPASKPPAVLAGLAAGVAAVLNPLADNGDGAPIDSPLGWTVLALTRKWSVESSEGDDGSELRATTFSTAATPDQAPVPAPDNIIMYNPVSATLYGTFNFVDPEGAPLTYYVLRNGLKGNVVYNQDGTFSYTPTQAARLEAAQTPGADRDGFALGATDGRDDGCDDGNSFFYAQVPAAQFTMTTPLTASGGATMAVVAPDGSRAYVNAYNDEAINVIDTTSGSVITSISVGRYPQSVTINGDGTRAYVAMTQGGVSVIDTTTNSVIDTVAIVDGATYVALSPDGTRGYVSNSSRGTVSVIDLTDNRVITTVEGLDAPFHIAVSPNGSKVYVNNVSNDSGEISIIDTTTNTVVDKIRVAPDESSSTPSGFAFSPDGNLIYVPDASRGVIAVVNTADNSLRDTITGFPGLAGFALSPDGSLAYVSNSEDNTVSIVNTATHAILATYQVADEPSALTASPDGQRVYIVRMNADAVSVLTFGPKVNLVPVAGATIIGAPDPVTGAVTITPNFTDPDGDALSYNVTEPANGTVVANTDGTFTYTPTATARHAAAADQAPDAALSDSFVITASDGTAWVPTTIVVAISPLNNAPSAAGPLRTVLGLTNLGGDFLVSADGSRVYVQTSDLPSEIRSLAIIDTATNTATLVPLNGRGDYYSNIGATYIPMVASSDGTRVYATLKDAISDDNFIAIVDTTTGSVERVEFPRTAQLYISPDSQYVYGLNTDGVAILDATTREVRSSTLPYGVYKSIAVRPDGTGIVVTDSAGLYVVGNDGSSTRYQLPGVADNSKPLFDASGTRIYVTTSRSSEPPSAQRYLTVVNTLTRESNDVAFTGDKLLTRPNSTDLYTIANNSELSIFDADGNTVDTVALGGTYQTGVISPDGRYLFAYDVFDGPYSPVVGSSSVALVDLESRSVVTVPLTSPAFDLVVSPDSSTAFAGPSPDEPNGLLSVINIDTGAVTNVIPVDGYPFTYSITPDGRYISILGSRADGTTFIQTYDVVISSSTITALSGYVDYPTFTDDGRYFYAQTGDEISWRVVSLAVPPPGDAGSGVTVGTPDAGSGAVTGAIRYTDADGDPLTYTVQIGPQIGAVTIDPTGGFTYIPDRSVTSDPSTTFTVIVDDGHGARVPVNVTVPVAAPNVAPTVSIRPIAGDYATGVITYEASSADPDSDPLTYSITVDPAKASVVDNADGTFTYTPTETARHAASANNAPYEDKWDTFTVTVTDPSGASASAVATAMISPANSSPTVTLTALGEAVGATGSVTYQVNGVDADGDPLGYAVTSNPMRGSLVRNSDGTYTYTPTTAARHEAALTNATDAQKQDSFTIAASDGYGGSASTVATFNISSSNTPPTLTIAQVGGVNPTTGAATFRVNSTDPDGDPLTYSVNNDVARGTVVRNTNGTYTFTPTAFARHEAALTDATAEQKQGTFDLVLADGHGGVSTVRAVVPLSPKNNRPTVSLTPVGPADASTGSVTYRVNGADADGDQLSYSIGVAPGKGSVVVNNDNTLTYTPTDAARHAASATGAAIALKRDTFSVVANDAHGGIVTSATTTVTVNPRNAAPTVALSQVGADPVAGSVTYRADGVDADGDSLTYTISTRPTKGTVIANGDGTFTYTATANAQHAAAADTATDTQRRDTFTITANDAHGGTAPASATATITPKNNAPTVTGHSGRQPELNHWSGHISGHRSGSRSRCFGLRGHRRSGEGHSDSKHQRHLHLHSGRHRPPQRGRSHRISGCQAGQLHRQHQRRPRWHHRRNGDYCCVTEEHGTDDYSDCERS